MSATPTSSRKPGSQPPSDERRARRMWPPTDSWYGAVLYAVIGGVVASILVGVLSHIRVYVSWH